MNREQQYRTGIFPLEPQVPAWVIDEVSAIVQDDCDPWGVLRLQRERVKRMCTPDPELAQARQALGLSDDAPSEGLLALTELRIKQEPEREAEFWEAMWIARRVATIESEYLFYLPQQALVLERRQQHREAGWPENWSAAHCRIWSRAGGTPATACAWARRGWSAVDALTADVAGKGSDYKFRMRVADLNPPEPTWAPMPTTSPQVMTNLADNTSTRGTR